MHKRSFTQSELKSLTRRQLQDLAKQCGLRANAKTVEIIDGILEMQHERDKKYRKKRGESTQSSPKKNFTPIKLPASPFMEKLGCGSKVVVYKFSREKKSPWAVKKLTAKADTSIRLRLEHEIEILKSLKHPNIVEYRREFQSDDGIPILLMELCDSSLLRVIKKRKNIEKNTSPFPPENILKVALHIGKALVYLHEEHNLLHGDLKSCNILVSGDFSAVKLCDFGVCVKLNSSLKGQKYAGEVYQGTENWWPKETLGEYNRSNISDKTDIYPYGLCLWEMLALQAPHEYLRDGDDDDDENDEEAARDDNTTKKYMAVDSDTATDDSEYVEESEGEKAFRAALGTCPPIPSNLDSSYKTVEELIICCCNENFRKRPSARKIVEVIEETAPDLTS